MFNPCCCMSLQMGIYILGGISIFVDVVLFAIYIFVFCLALSLLTTWGLLLGLFLNILIIAAIVAAALLIVSACKNNRKLCFIALIVTAVTTFILLILIILGFIRNGVKILNLCLWLLFIFVKVYLILVAFCFVQELKTQSAVQPSQYQSNQYQPVQYSQRQQQEEDATPSQEEPGAGASKSHHHHGRKHHKKHKSPGAAESQEG